MTRSFPAGAVALLTSIALTAAAQNYVPAPDGLYQSTLGALLPTRPYVSSPPRWEGDPAQTESIQVDGKVYRFPSADHVAGNPAPQPPDPPLSERPAYPSPPDYQQPHHSQPPQQPFAQGFDQGVLQPQHPAANYPVAPGNFSGGQYGGGQLFDPSMMNPAPANQYPGRADQGVASLDQGVEVEKGGAGGAELSFPQGTDQSAQNPAALPVYPQAAYPGQNYPPQGYPQQVYPGANQSPWSSAYQPGVGGNQPLYPPSNWMYPADNYMGMPDPWTMMQTSPFGGNW